MLEHYMPMLAGEGEAGSYVTQEAIDVGGGTLSGTLAMPRALYIDADNSVVLIGLRDAYSGVYANAATVTAVLRDVALTALAPSITCEYQSGTDGEYVGIIDSSKTASVVEGDRYYVDVDIVTGQYKDFRRVEIKGRYHGVE